MKLEQKKSLRPTFLFEHDNKVLKVTRRSILSKSSFEIQIAELSPNRLEESKFALAPLCSAVLCSILGIYLAYIGAQQGLEVDGGALYFLSVTVFVLTGISIYSCLKNTYDYVMLCRKDTGIIALSFYRTSPSEKSVDNYINSIKQAIEGNNNKGFSP